MTRWLVIVAVVTLGVTGCDALFGVRAFPDAAIDTAATIDAAPVACADRQAPKPALCADFDEAPALLYLGSTPSAWPLVGTGAAPEIRHPGNVGSGALWVTDHGGTYATVFDPHKTATVVTATFDFRVDAESVLPVESSLMMIAFDGSGHSSCYANFVIDESVPTLRVKGSCGNPDPHAEVVIPFGWVHVVFAFDISGRNTATLTINDTPSTITFDSGALSNLHYTIQVGLDVAGLDGLVVAYDSIVVTSQ